MGSLVGDVGKGLGSFIGGISGGIAEGVGAVPDFQAKLDPAVLAQQQEFIQALQNQKGGLGYNLGQEQLKQATAQNMAQAAAMAGSQKGISPALAARQAEQQRAAIQQQGAMQSGLVSAQQQMQERQQDLARQQLIGQTLGQQQQQQLAQQQIQAGLAGQAAQARAQIGGGIMSGLAGGLTAFNPPAKAGGKAEGGLIPGKAQVKGDSQVNDTVVAKVSPGEIVIPRSIVNAKNAPELAAKFVADTLKKNKPEMKENFADGGEIPAYLQPNALVPSNILEQTQASLAQQMPTAPTVQPGFFEKLHGETEQRLTGQGPSIAQAFMEKLTPKNVTPEMAQQLGIKPTAQPEQRYTPMQSTEQGLQVTQMPSASLTQPVQPLMAGAEPDIYGYGAMSSQLMKGIGEQKAGLYKEAAATGALGQQQAAKLDQYQRDLMTRQQDFEKNTTDIQNKIKQTTQDLTTAKIDPNKYLGDMSTMGKVSTTIGLILGGIGGGLSGRGGNVALDVLNKQIDRDIEAQKANLNQKNTLLSEYYKQYGNMKDAEMMTRATMGDMVSNQLKSLAAESQDPIARARALQAAGKIDTEMSQTVGAMAAKKAIMQGVTGGQAPAELKIRALVPENQQKDYYKELQDMQNTVKTRDNILSSFDKLKNLATVGGYITSPLATSRQVSAIKEPLVAALSKETAGRFTEQDAAMLEPIFPQAGDSEATLRAKKAALDNLISDKMNFPMLKPLGITPESMSRYAFGKHGEKGIQLGKPVLKGK
jgi:hypothetical protein